MLITSKVWTFEIQILQTTSDEKTVYMKVVDLKKLWNFVVHHFFIWNRLEPQKLNLPSVVDNMWRTEVGYEHKLLMGGVVEVFTREGEFVGSNPRCRVARDFTRKNARLRRRRAAAWD